MLRDYDVEISMRPDIFQAKLAAEKNMKSSGEWDRLDSESQRLVEKMIVDGKRAGLALPEEERDELKALKKALSDLCLQFSDNYNQENVSTYRCEPTPLFQTKHQGKISFTLAELEGVPNDVISGYTKRQEGEAEIYDVTFKTPDIFPIVSHSSWRI
jgi:Zn-dependent oligopeptidase